MEINLHVYLHYPPNTAVIDGLNSLSKGQTKTMAILDDIQAKQAEEKVDIAAVGEAVKTILATVASGALDQTKAQTILDEAATQDGSLKAILASFQANVAPTPAPAPAPVDPGTTTDQPV